MMDALGIYLGNKKQWKTVAIVGEDTDFGRGGADAFKAVAEKAGVQVVSTDFHPQNAPDFTSILTRLQQRRPDAIATFQVGGDSINFLRQAMMAWPKPAQKPHPPILVGGAFPYGARRAVRYGDGWMPLRRRKSYAEVRDLIPKFQAMAKEANRDLASLPVSIWESKEDEGELKRDQDAGVVRVIVSLDSEKSDKILPQLDRWAKLAAKVE